MSATPRPAAPAPGPEANGAIPPRGGAVPIIHAVTSDEIVARADFLPRARAVMRSLGPRGAVQLRARAIGGSRLHALAAALAETQATSGAWLVVNDRVDVALTVGARGVQLTSRSMRVADARRIAPALAVGASIHGLEEAEAAAGAGAAWAVAGHVFESRSHPGEPGRGATFIRALVERLPALPIIAIGGIRPADVAALRAMGARGIAAIRGIWEAGDAERAAIDYLSAYDGRGS